MFTDPDRHLYVITEPSWEDAVSLRVWGVAMAATVACALALGLACWLVR
ncbi:MAG: hypothetical protein Q7T73_21890 [Beijerinckiaceae bacterium]|nr:hypothetical protein [Beijerinckiaceae bacterium]